MTTVAPRFFASASAAAAIFFAASSVSTFFTGSSGFAAAENDNVKTSASRKMRFICTIGRGDATLLTPAQRILGSIRFSRVGERVLAIANLSVKIHFDRKSGRALPHSNTQAPVLQFLSFTIQPADSIS